MAFRKYGAALLGLFGGLVSFGPSSAQAQFAGYQCMSEGSENVLCAWLPSDAEAAQEKREFAAGVGARVVPPKSVAKHVNGAQKRRVTMLTRDVLTGGGLGLENEFTAEALAGGDEGKIVTRLGRADLEAGRAAARVQEEISDLEVFLKSGPAANGDLTVISAGAKDK